MEYKKVDYKNTCDTCLYGSFSEKRYLNDYGECRYNPPLGRRGFPKIKKEYWCGKHTDDTSSLRI